MRPHSLHGIYTLISVLPFQSSRGILGGRIPASLLVLVIVLCVFSFTSIFPVCFTLTLYFLETTHVGIQQIPTFPCTYRPSIVFVFITPPSNHPFLGQHLMQQKPHLFFCVDMRYSLYVLNRCLNVIWGIRKRQQNRHYENTIFRFNIHHPIITMHYITNIQQANTMFL